MRRKEGYRLGALVALSGLWWILLSLAPTLLHAAQSDIGASVLQPSAFLQAPGCQPWSTAPSVGHTICIISHNTILQRGQVAKLPVWTSVFGQGAACCVVDEGADGSPCGSLLSPLQQVPSPPPVPPAISLWTSASAPDGYIGLNRSAVTQLSVPPQAAAAAATPPADLPVLNLASLSDIFTLPPNGSLALCSLRIEGAVLPRTFPLQAASFLALSAVNLTAALAGRAPCQPPPLLLSNLIIVTPSCPAALPLHQAFACNISPSPNFTVTPTSLIVHRFTTPTASITNVTLICATTPTTSSASSSYSTSAATPPPPPTTPLMPAAPFPCLAARVSSGSELLDAMASMDALAQVAKAQFSQEKVYGHLYLDAPVISLDLPSATTTTISATTTIAITSTDQQGEPPTEAEADAQAAQMQRSITVNTATFVLAGRSVTASSSYTVLDLHGSVGVVVVSDAATVELQQLALRAAPLGLPSQGSLAFLRLLLWSFDFPRLYLGASRRTALKATNCSLEVPREELALWMAMLLGGTEAVPTKLRDDLCACNPGRAMSSDSPNVELVQVPGKGPSLLWRAGSSFSGSYLVSNLLLTVDDSGPWCGDGDAGDAGPAAAAAAEVACSSDGSSGGGRTCPRTRASLCAYIPEGVCGGVLADLGDSKPFGNMPPASLQNSLSESSMGLWTLTPDLPTRDVVRLSVPLLYVSPTTGAHLSASVPGVFAKPSTLMGSFTKPLAFDVGLLPGAFVIANSNATSASLLAGAAAKNASLTLRAMVLVNLPSSGNFSWFVPTAGPGPPLPPSPSSSVPAATDDFDHTASKSSRRRVQQQWAGLGWPVATRAALGGRLGQPGPKGAGLRPGNRTGGSGSRSSNSGGAGSACARMLQVVTAPDTGGANTTGSLTQGMDRALTNFTSCLWFLSFDRVASSARHELLLGSPFPSSTSAIDPGRPMGLPYVFLDSVVAVIPQAELDALAWVWANNSTAAATAPGLADQLAEMLAGSRLSEESSSVLVQAAAQNSTANVTALRFEQLWWCAVEGYNVTFTSQLPQVFGGKVNLTSLQLQLPVNYYSQPAPATATQYPPPSAPSTSPPPLRSSLLPSSLPGLPVPPRPPSPPQPHPPLGPAPTSASWLGSSSPGSAADSGRSQPHYSKPRGLVVAVAAASAVVGITALSALALFVALRRQWRQSLAISAVGKKFNFRWRSALGFSADVGVQLGGSGSVVAANLSPAKRDGGSRCCAELAPAPTHVGNVAGITSHPSSCSRSVSFETPHGFGIQSTAGHIAPLKLCTRGSALGAAGGCGASGSGGSLPGPPPSVTSGHSCCSGLPLSGAQSPHGTLLTFYHVMHMLTIKVAAGAKVESGSLDCVYTGPAAEASPDVADACIVAVGDPGPPARAGAGSPGAAASTLVKGPPLLAGAEGVDAGAKCWSGDSSNGPMLSITGELGRGAQGMVYRGVWRALDVAVKSRLLLQSELLLGDGRGGEGGASAAGLQGAHSSPAATPGSDPARNQQPRRGTIQEAAISASVSHPNVVATYTYSLQRLAAAAGNGALPQGQPGPATATTTAPQATENCAAATAAAAVPYASTAVELDVWKLTLIQELCDGNSLRHCLGAGTLAGCRAVEVRPCSSNNSSSWMQLAWRRIKHPGSSSSSGGCEQGVAVQQQQPLDRRVMLMVALQAVRGLAHLHSFGIVHADVSSANILLKVVQGPQQQQQQLAQAGGSSAAAAEHQVGACFKPSDAAAGDPYWYGYVAKVGDFGLSGRLDDALEASHLSGPARGVSAYCAPELARYGHTSPAGDVYAFAIVLWELSLGRPLPALLARPEGARLQAWLAQQSRADPQAVEPLPPGLLTWPEDVPPDLLGLAGECLRGDPAARPTSQQLYDRLHVLLTGRHPPPPPRNSPPQPPPSPPPDSRAQKQQPPRNFAGGRTLSCVTSEPGTSYLSLEESSVS